MPPSNPAEDSLALHLAGSALASSLALPGPFPVGPVARRMRVTEPGLPSLPGCAPLGACGQHVSGLLLTCPDHTVSRGPLGRVSVPLWASVSPSLHRRGGVRPVKTMGADPAQPSPSTRLAAGPLRRGVGCCRGWGSESSPLI